MTSDRRASPRFACEVDVSVRAPDGAVLPARTVDISFSGICVVAPSGVAPGTLVHFVLRLVFDGKHSDDLSLPGHVVWSTPTQGEFQLGARFDPQMDDADWSRLDVLLKFLAGDLDLQSL